MVFKKRGSLTVISRIVLFFLVIGFIWLLVYAVNYEKQISPVLILNTSSDQLSNNSILLAPHGYAWLSIPKQREFTAKVNRCPDEDVDFRSEMSYENNTITFNPLYEQVNFVQGEFVLLNNTDYETEEFLLERSVYVLTIINGEEQRISLLDEKFSLEGKFYLRFNSLCEGSSLNISWGEEI